MDVDSVKDIVSKHFSADQWNAYAEIEKTRICNTYINEKMLERLGIPVAISWVDRYVRNLPPGRSNNDNPQYGNEIISERNSTNEEKLSPSQEEILHLWTSVELQPDVGNRVKIRNYESAEDKRRSIEPPPKQSRYAMRQRAHTNAYFENKITNEDDLLFCDECDTDYEGACEQHLYLLLRNKTCPRDEKDETRSMKTTPWPLFIFNSKIQGAGKGVWCHAHLPKGLVFGPYEGKMLLRVLPREATGYGWRIRGSKYRNLCIDAFDPSVSNWLRYVNCSRSPAETNLAAFQYKGQIYYKTIQPIERGTELMVWYGDEYGKELGIPVKSSTIMTDFTNFLAQGNHVIKFGGKADGFRCFQKHQGGPYLFPAFQLLHQYLLKKSLNSPAKLQKSIQRSVPINAGSSTNWNKKNLKERRFQCNHCQARFSRKSDLTRHIRIHTGEKPFVCDHCQARFCQKSHLTSHMRIHTGKKPFVCDHCQARFCQKSHLTSHMRIHTGEKPFVCDQCEARFSHKNSLTCHIIKHTGEKPFECDQCQARFCQKTTLTDHMRIHTGEKPFVCDHCQARFSHKTTLTNHMRIHTGEKPFVCYHCQTRFSRKGDLTRHIRIHTGEKPFVCDHCQARFSHKTTLTNHMRIHTGEKPFVCDHCQARLSRKGDLTRHIRIHTGKKPFECDSCKKTFRYSRQLKSHSCVP